MYRRALVIAGVLSALALGAYLAGHVSVYFEEGGIDGPCSYVGGAGLGSTLTSETGFWPPSATCIVEGRTERFDRVVTYEAIWVPPVTGGLLMCAGLVMTAGIVSRRLDT